MLTAVKQIEPCAQRAPRVPLRLPVLLEDSLLTTRALTGNLSETGMFVEMADAPPAPGAILTFELGLRKGQVRGLGKVIWIRVNTMDTLGLPSGLAVEFLAVRDRSSLRKEVQDFSSGSLQAS